MKKIIFLLCCISFFATPYTDAQHICMDRFLGDDDHHHHDHDDEDHDGHGGVLKGVFLSGATWKPGQTLRVRFLNGNSTQKAMVRKHAVEWSNYGNIHFQFVNSGFAEIRINFDNSGSSWSNVGTDALSIPQNRQTMNFGWFGPGTNEGEYRRTILHEFGHALGMLHEHQNPLSPIKWNKPVVYAFYARQGWSKQDVDRNLFARYSVGHTNGSYDKTSIMHYPIDRRLTLDGYGVDWNRVLSAEDKAFVAQLYPKVSTESKEQIEVEDIYFAHNKWKDGKLGMEIKSDFVIRKGKGQEYIMGVFFFHADGRPLRDYNNRYVSSDGQVYTGTDFVPDYEGSRFTGLSAFIPYDELHTRRGKSKLKLKVAYYDIKDEKIIYEGGFHHFDYQEGATCSTIDVDIRYDEPSSEGYGLRIFPMFSVENAAGQRIECNAYFYFQDGRVLKDFGDGYGSGDGNVFVGEVLYPPHDISHFSMGDYYDFNLFIPYDQLHLAHGVHELKFFVSLEENGKEIAKSQWFNFTIEVP